MRNWIKRNLKNIIVFAFVIPILLVAFVSISHVTSFYGISNPWSWALYLSVGIEIAALSALAAVSVRMGRFIYIPFLIVTLIQMIGNVFFSFSYIDETSEIFKDWVSMVGGLFENMGVEVDDIASHKLILSFLTGGLLPIISLTFAHMLVKYSEQNAELKQTTEDEVNVEDYELQKEEFIKNKIKEEDEIRYKPTEEDIKKFDDFLSKIGYQGPIKENIDYDNLRYEPTEEDIKKFEEILSKPKFNIHNKTEPTTPVENNLEENIVETISEQEKEVPEEISENETEVQDIKPEPVDADQKYKVLNYFKKSD
jgi:hypothetical protein